MVDVEQKEDVKETVEEETKESEGVEITVESQQSDDSSASEVVVSEEKPSKENEDELSDYSKRVQKRIKALTDKNKDEIQKSQEAIRYAQQVKEENEKLKQRIQGLDQGYLSEYGTRIESQLAAAKQLYKEAHDAGDADKLFNAQETLSKIAIEQERYRVAKDRNDRAKEIKSEPVASTQQQQPQQQPAVEPDPKASSWAEKNTWFGENEIMTQAAFTIHRQLVEEEGFDPKADEYYSEIDRRMREEFPQRFSSASRKNGGSVKVASADTSASRNSKSGRRTVKLSPSQIAIAKKLGVPLEEYAKYVKD